ncbi:MAG: isoprenylcysteine carboxylmethyltransferase family protein [Halobacteriaceae archaeon]
MVGLSTILFGIGLGAAITIIITLVLTLSTDYRLWPPGDDRRKAILHWGLVTIFDIAIFSVAILNWDSWILPRPETIVIGAVFVLIGLIIFIYSGRMMDRAETTGQTVTDLYTDGPYARSRNPQYVGMIVGLVGLALLVNAIAVIILVAFHIVWIMLLTFAEEMWLQYHFGEEFKQYCQQVPRFIGIRSFTK